MNKTFNKMYVVNLLLGLFVAYSIMSLFAFNKNFCFINEKVNAIFVFVIPGIISVLFSMHMKIRKNKIEKKLREQNTENQDENCLKSPNSIWKYVIINTITYILLSIIMYLFMNYVFGIIGFWRDEVSEVYYDKECFEVCDSYAVTLTSISLILMIVLIPSNITIYNLTKPNNEQVRKIIKVPLYLVTVSLILLSICANIDIPEFRLDCYKREDGSIGIRDIFVDARNERFKTEVRIPEKIWFKPVGYVYDVCGKKVILSNKINYDAIASLETYRIRGSTDIEMDGLPITWYVEDNIIYKTDGTEMTITSTYYGENKKTINISENIKKVNGANNLLTSNVEVIVDEKNPYFLSSDGMVFTKSNIKFVGRSIIIGEPNEMSLEEKKLNMQYCYVFDNYEGEKQIVLNNSMSENLTIDSNSDFVLVYPKELSKRIIVYQEYINHISGFEVDEENNIYELYKNGVYDEDLTCLYNITNETDVIHLPSTMREFDENVIELLKNRDVEFEIEEGNQYFTYENGILYNFDKTEIIYSNKKS